MTKWGIPWLTLALFAMSCQASGSMLRLELKEEVYASASTYRLSDLLPAETVEQVPAELAEIVIGETPRPGQSIWVTARDIMTRLGQHAGDIKLQGDSRVRVIATGVERSLDSGVEVAQRELESWLALRYGNYSVASKGVPASLATYEGELGFAVRMPPKPSLSKRMRVLLDVLVNNEVFTTVPVWFSVSVIEPVWRLGERVDENTLVNMANLSRGDADVAGIQGKPFRGDLTGLRFVRHRPKGVILKEEDIETLPAVTRGARIQVMVSQGVVNLVALGEALTDGELHDQVRVRNLNSGESFFATVIGESRVRVQ